MTRIDKVSSLGKNVNYLSIRDSSVTSPDFPRYRVFIPEYCALSCQHAASVIVDQAIQRRSYGVAALAVHGLMESWNKKALGSKINRIQMIVPDGQPVIWALNLLHQAWAGFQNTRANADL